MQSNAASRAIPSTGVAWATLKNLWQWTLRSTKVRKARRLRVCETISLGERRFVAVIAFDQQEFLVGGAGNSLELLARLHDGALVTESTLQREALPL